MERQMCNEKEEGSDKKDEGRDDREEKSEKKEAVGVRDIQAALVKALLDAHLDAKIAHDFYPYVDALVEKGYTNLALLEYVDEDVLWRKPALPARLASILVKRFQTKEARTLGLYTAFEAMTSEVPPIAPPSPDSPPPSPPSEASETIPEPTRTFGDICAWDWFDRRMDHIPATLDDVERKYYKVIVPGTGSSWLSGTEVRAILSIVAPLVNDVARNRGLEADLRGATERTLSRTEWYVRLLPEARELLARGGQDKSKQVGSVLAIKEEWQAPLEMTDDVTCLSANPERLRALLPALQQMFGDMVLDEAPVGLLTRIEVSVAVRRSDDVTNKNLYVSKPFGRDRLLVGLLVLMEASAALAPLKPILSRRQVALNPRHGYLTAPSYPSTVGNESNEGTEEDGASLQDYDFDQVGLTGNVLGYGRWGWVLEGVIDSHRVAIKTFDPRRPEAMEAFTQERTVYLQLSECQGVTIPRLLLAGRFGHTASPFLVLSEEGSDLSEVRLTPHLQQGMRDCLSGLHSHGFLHGDVALRNFLVKESSVKIIDFEWATACSDRDLQRAEMLELEELIEEWELEMTEVKVFERMRDIA